MSKVLRRLSLTSTSNTDTTHLRITPMPNIVLIMRTRLSWNYTWILVVAISKVDWFSVVTMCHDTERESFEYKVILLNSLLVSECLFWKEFELIIRYAECRNFEVANQIKPALTSCETTRISVLEVVGTTSWSRYVQMCASYLTIQRTTLVGAFEICVRTLVYEQFETRETLTLTLTPNLTLTTNPNGKLFGSNSWHASCPLYCKVADAHLYISRPWSSGDHWKWKSSLNSLIYLSLDKTNLIGFSSTCKEFVV